MPQPMQGPRASMNWQYFDARDVAIDPKTTMNNPTQIIKVSGMEELPAQDSKNKYEDLD